MLVVLVMRRFTVSFTAVLGLAACSPQASPTAPAPAAADATSPATDAAPARLTDDATALVTVRAASWNASHGTLRRYRRDDGGAWTAVSEDVRVMLGQSGLGWGRGRHGDGNPIGDDGPEKREGDNRSPAGAFFIRHTYGYAEAPPEGTVVPYTAMTPTLQCIEDAKSAYYNQIIDRAAVQPDWTSTDRLRRTDDLYEWIAFVEHNTSPAVPGLGSCILLHVWISASTPTHGCTSMERDALASLIAGLSTDKNLLVQLPDAAYEAVAEDWGLPR